MAFAVSLKKYQRSRGGRQRLTDDGFTLQHVRVPPYQQPVGAPWCHGVTPARRHLADRDRRPLLSAPVGEQSTVAPVAKVHRQTSPTSRNLDDFLKLNHP
ncbi:hypothetical protein QTP88_024846 [Uroleucon formosanum]